MLAAMENALDLVVFLNWVGIFCSHSKTSKFARAPSHTHNQTCEPLCEPDSIGIHRVLGISFSSELHRNRAHYFCDRTAFRENRPLIVVFCSSFDSRTWRGDASTFTFTTRPFNSINRSNRSIFPAILSFVDILCVCVCHIAFPLTLIWLQLYNRWPEHTTTEPVLRKGHVSYMSHEPAAPRRQFRCTPLRAHRTRTPTFYAPHGANAAHI